MRVDVSKFMLANRIDVDQCAWTVTTERSVDDLNWMLTFGTAYLLARHAAQRFL